ncbi:MAG: methyltransferase domain-containing protein [Chloroflexi bacterium]|nr:methyltransferase domain-containing protein [Chloroflexota bacterium]
MDWHTRYTQQAGWTRDLRVYIFSKIKLSRMTPVLEVGCGTGAILSGLPPRTPIHGLDLDPAALSECKVHAPAASLTQGNALRLPYSSASFEVVYCHFLLLWVGDPLQALLEMKRVARPGGQVIAFAEPDYSRRVDKPDEFIQLGKWQTESLIKQGADPSLGANLAELFFQAGIKIVETGTIQNLSGDTSPAGWEMEWAVAEADLAGSVPDADIQRMKLLDQIARAQGKRVLSVPTHFAWGSV